MPKSQQSWARSQHPPTQWNLRGGRLKQCWIQYIKKIEPSKPTKKGPLSNVLCESPFTIYLDFKIRYESTPLPSPLFSGWQCWWGGGGVGANSDEGDMSVGFFPFLFYDTITMNCTRLRKVQTVSIYPWAVYTRRCCQPLLYQTPSLGSEEKDH